MEQFKQWLKKTGKRTNTIKRYVYVAEDFRSWFSGRYECKFDPQMVGRLHIENWIHCLQYEAKYLYGKNQEIRSYSNATVRSCIIAIRSYFEFWCAEGTLSGNPVVNVKNITSMNDVRWLDESEKSILLSFFLLNCRENSSWRMIRNRAIVYLCLFAGPLVNELLQIRLSDVRIKEGRIRFRNASNGQERWVPIGPDLRSVLAEWLKIRNKEILQLFYSQKGEMTEDGVTYLFRDLARQTNIFHLSARLLRHTYAHDQVSNGVDIKEVADRLGQVNANYVRLYRRT